MAFENITVTQYDTDSGTVAGPDSTAAMQVQLSLTGVAAGAALAVIGTVVITSGWPYAQLTSVSDSNGDTWGEIRHFNSGVAEDTTFYTSARHVFALCTASDGGNVTVTLNFNGVYPFGGAIESVPSSKGVQYNLALVEIPGMRTSSPIDVAATDVVTSGTTTEVVTGALSQTDNLILYSHGTWVSYSGAPASFTSMLSANNGAIIGGLLAYRKITSASSQTITHTHGSAASAVGGWAIVLRAAETAGGTYRYKLQLDPTTFDETDTNLTVYIWRNSAFDTGIAEKYTGQAGETDGSILITTGLPSNLTSSDVITFLVVSGDGTTRAGPGVGTVEAV